MTSSLAVDKVVFQSLRKDLKRHAALIEEYFVHKMNATALKAIDISGTADDRKASSLWRQAGEYAILLSNEFEYYVGNVPVFRDTNVAEPGKQETEFITLLFGCFLRRYGRMFGSSEADDSLATASVMLLELLNDARFVKDSIEELLPLMKTRNPGRHVAFLKFLLLERFVKDALSHDEARQRIAEAIKSLLCHELFGLLNDEISDMCQKIGEAKELPYQRWTPLIRIMNKLSLLYTIKITGGTPNVKLILREVQGFFERVSQR